LPKTSILIYMFLWLKQKSITIKILKDPNQEFPICQQKNFHEESGNVPEIETPKCLSHDLQHVQ
jgi:hypothetical protein